MKMNLRVFKKGKPIYWIIGAVVLFVIFYLLFNKGAGSTSSGSTQVVTTGPSEGLQIAGMQTQVQMASIQASQAAQNREIEAGLAAVGLQMQTRMAEIQAGADTARIAYEHDAAITFASLDTQKYIANQQYTYGIESAKIVTEGALASKAIDASVFMYQMDKQAQMYEIQSANLIKQSAVAAVSGPHVKEITRAPILLEAMR